MLKEEPLRDARLERPGWVWGGSAFILAKSSFLLQMSLQDFVHLQTHPGSCTTSTSKMPPHRCLPRAQTLPVPSFVTDHRGWDAKPKGG